MDYLPLSQAASELKVTVDELIRRGADGEIDIYVIPNPAWTLKAVGVHKRVFENGDEGGEVFEGEVTGLAATLLRLKVAPLILESYRHHPNDTAVDGFIYADPKRGITGLLQPHMDLPIYLKDCRLVVRESDLPTPRKKPSRPKMSVETDTSESVPMEAFPAAPMVQPVKPLSPNKKLLRMADLVEMTGLAKSTLYDRIKQGKFPAQEVSRGGRASFWKRELVEAWIDGNWPPRA